MKRGQAIDKLLERFSDSFRLLCSPNVTFPVRGISLSYNREANFNSFIFNTCFNGQLSYSLYNEVYLSNKWLGLIKRYFLIDFFVIFENVLKNAVLFKFLNGGLYFCLLE